MTSSKRDIIQPYESKWLGPEFRHVSEASYRNVTAIIAIKESGRVVIKGDTLALEVKNDGSGEIVAIHYATKLVKMTDKLVLGTSFIMLSPAQQGGVNAFLSTYNGSDVAVDIANNTANFLTQLLRDTPAGLQLLLAGYEGESQVIYRIEYRNNNPQVNKVEGDHSSVGVEVIIEDILTRGFVDLSAEHIFEEVSGIEQAHIAEYGSIMFHIGGDITGWEVTPSGASELPVMRQLPTHVQVGDFVRSILR